MTSFSFRSRNQDGAPGGYARARLRTIPGPRLGHGVREGPQRASYSSTWAQQAWLRRTRAYLSLTATLPVKRAPRATFLGEPLPARADRNVDTDPHGRPDIGPNTGRTDRHRDRRANRKIDKQRHRQAGGDVNKDAGCHTDRKADRQAERLTQTRASTCRPFTLRVGAFKHAPTHARG